MRVLLEKEKRDEESGVVWFRPKVGVKMKI
jgi:hypothetical protein